MAPRRGAVDGLVVPAREDSVAPFGDEATDDHGTGGKGAEEAAEDETNEVEGSDATSTTIDHAPTDGDEDVEPRRVCPQLPSRPRLLSAIAEERDGGESLGPRFVRAPSVAAFSAVLELEPGSPVLLDDGEMAV